jgi:CBS domain-containing protein
MREQELQKNLIKHLDLDPATSVESGKPLQDVLEQMKKDESTCVLICKDGRCVGIFTERDYVCKVLSVAADRSKAIDEFMSVHPKTLTLDDTVRQAISLMNEYGYRNIPLVDQEGRSTGLLQIRNIIQFLAELYPEEVLNVSPRSESFRNTDGA